MQNRRFWQASTTRAALSGLALAALALPSLAQDQTALTEVIAASDEGDSASVLAAAYAACLAGDGDGEATLALFQSAGWEGEMDAETGSAELSGPTPELYALIYDSGFCMVLDEATGTDAARSQADAVITAAGYSQTLVQPDSYCPLFELKPNLVLELTSSGNDPVCEDAQTSGLRLSWEQPEE